MREVDISPNLLLALTRNKIGIDDLVDALDARRAFGEIEADEVFRSWKKSQVRRAAKRLKSEDGFPLIFSIVDVVNGHMVHRYKQESLFSIIEYKQVIEQYRSTRLRYTKIEKRLIENARAKFGGQTDLFGARETVGA